MSDATTLSAEKVDLDAKIEAYVEALKDPELQGEMLRLTRAGHQAMLNYSDLLGMRIAQLK